MNRSVPCAQRQDVVVAHQPGGGPYFLIHITNSLRRVNESVDSAGAAVDPDAVTRTSAGRIDAATGRIRTILGPARRRRAGPARARLQ